MNFDGLERAILRWIRERTKDAQLRAQLVKCELGSREHTGSSRYTSFLVPSEMAECKVEKIDGPSIDSPKLEGGGGCILWCAEGRVDTLELFTTGDTFPEHLEEFELKAG